jgi:hypothetical protein
VAVSAAKAISREEGYETQTDGKDI